MEKITAILFVSFLLLLGVILYRLLLRKLSKGRIKNENYCTLYSLDKNPASGEVAFYFVSPFKIPIEFSIWEGEIKVLELRNEEFSEGGHIIHFDTNKLKNGDYLFGLVTSEQKTIKRFQINND
jgi:hypothetical protein